MAQVKRLCGGCADQRGVDAWTILAKTTIGFFDVRGYTNGRGIKDSLGLGGLFHHLVFDSCWTAVRFCGSCSGDSLVNCTIEGGGLTGGSMGIRSVNGAAARSASILNCIIADCDTGIVKADSFTISEGFNDLWGVTVKYVGLSGAASDLALPPRFRLTAANDFRLSGDSPLLNRAALIHSGSSPFDFLEWGPDIGAWESLSSKEDYSTASWARGAWGRNFREIK